MRQFSAALLSRAFRPVKVLLAPPRGRHAAGGRRRSGRVRRYVSSPAPAPAPVPSTPASPLSPPRQFIPAEYVAAVRPYYEAHERKRELARARVQETARLYGRVPRPRFSGDLLAEPAPPGKWHELATLTRVWIKRRRAGVPA